MIHVPSTELCLGEPDQVREYDDDEPNEVKQAADLRGPDVRRRNVNRAGKI